MKIVRLQAENIKRILAVDITPDAAVVEISGKNGSGKTSILDAIWWTLGSAKNVQDKPVRDGAESGHCTLDLGEYVVTRRFRVKDDGEYTTSITVQNADGFKASSPQEILDGFVGKLSFDPLAFSRMRPADQVAALRDLVPDFDFDAEEKAIKVDFDARTDVNRRIRDLKGQLAGMAFIEGAPSERLSAEALISEINEAMQFNRSIELDEVQRREAEARMDRFSERIKAANHEIARLQQEIESLKTSIDQAQLDLDGKGPLKDPIDIEPLREKLSDMERLNRLFDQAAERDRLVGELEKNEAASRAYSDAIEQRKERMNSAVSSANLPVPGMRFSEDGVYVGDVPFSQLSDAQQLQVSIAVAGAMNPRLRVIRVRDGSLLDTDAMAYLRGYAAENDLQIWIERVSDGEGSGLIIEDGLLKATPHQQAAE